MLVQKYLWGLTCAQMIYSPGRIESLTASNVLMCGDFLNLLMNFEKTPLLTLTLCYLKACHGLASVKHVGGSTVLWDWFAATGTLCSNRIMKEHYLQIHQLHLKSTVRRLKLGHRREFQQNNDPKHTTLFLEWIKQASIKVLECPSGRPQTRVFCPEDSLPIWAEICRSLLMATCATC